MAYKITFTKRFEKHFKDLNAHEKKQLKNKLLFFPKTPCIRLCGQNAFRELIICLSAASTWMCALFGTMRAISLS